MKLEQMLLWTQVVWHLRASAVDLPEITDERFIGQCVRQHNEARSSAEPPASDMLYMTWDEGLAVIARAWAKKCVYDHNENRHTHTNFTYLGENIWAGYPPSHFTVKKAVDLWVSETKDYNYRDNSCNEGKKCGHYTQIVWAGTHKVGCAAQLCPDGAGVFSAATVLFVCNYAPGGNIGGVRPYDATGPACSRCTGHCRDKLCRSPEQDTPRRYDWTTNQEASSSGRAKYVAILITRPVALLFTFLAAYAVHYMYPSVFCYE